MNAYNIYTAHRFTQWFKSHPDWISCEGVAVLILICSTLILIYLLLDKNKG